MVRAATITTTHLYTYNGAGLLVAQELDGVETAFTWDQALALPQVLATSNGLRGLYGLERLGVVVGGAWYYPEHDAIGSVRQWTDALGAVVGLQGYAPFGEALVPLGPPPAPWGFTGEWQDPAGLVYLRARWYHPGLGRFAQMDPVPGVLARPATRHDYAYALNSPTLYSDPSGKALPVEGPGSPFRSDWPLWWQQIWFLEWGGPPTSQQWAVIDEVRDLVEPLAPHGTGFNMPGAGVYTAVGRALAHNVDAEWVLPDWPWSPWVMPPPGYPRVDVTSDIRRGPGGTYWATTGFLWPDATAWACGNTIIFEPAFISDRPSQNHEYYHTLQYGRLGITYWHIYSTWAALRGTRRAHPLEWPAYRIGDLYRANRWLPDLWEFPWVALANQRGAR